MPDCFATFDDWLIERAFQPLCDAAVNHTGFDRRSLACGCLDVAALALIILHVWSLVSLEGGWQSIAGGVEILILLTGTIALVSLRSVFARSLPLRQANPLRSFMRPHRAVVLLLLVDRLARMQDGSLSSVVDALMLLFTMAAFYLGACAERPRGRASSKLMLGVDYRPA